MSLYMCCYIFDIRGVNCVAFNADPVLIVNFFLCLVILVMGFLIYARKENFSACMIGVAFGMFGLSHFTQLFGIDWIPDVTFILIRVCGYILVIAALWLYLIE